ncbi:MAG TPA: hypothetical protein VK824_02680 [Planctomycetota bacterium]|nr:hypothetical protein [Planctomycetota bacterium]
MLKLLLALPPERFAALYLALPEEMARALDGAIASMLHARPASVRRQPDAVRVKALRAFLVRSRDETLGGDLLRAYFLGPRKPLVVQFLDATGVKHQEGQVEEEGQPDPAKVGEAIAALNAAHDPQDVALYLAIAAVQWPEIKELKAAAATPA